MVESTGLTTTAGDEWVIEPRREGPRAVALDVWRYRRLMRFFASRALRKQYARTILGWAWLLIRPLFPLFVNTVIFGGVLGASAGVEVPYFLFLVVGSSLWEFFSSAVMWGTRSLELNRGMLSRIYIPRLILPIAMVSPAALTFAIHTGVIAVSLVYYGLKYGTWYLHASHIGWALQALALAWMLALGLALWTSVPALIARDVRFTLNYVLSFWVFLTPVMYPLSAVPERYRWIVALNPMTAAIETFKFGVLSIGGIDRTQLAASWGTALLLLVSGLAFFSRAERTSADQS